MNSTTAPEGAITIEMLLSVPYGEGIDILLNPASDLSYLLEGHPREARNFANLQYAQDKEVLACRNYCGQPIAFALCDTAWAGTPAAQDLDILKLTWKDPENKSKNGYTVAHELAEVSSIWAYTKVAQNYKILSLESERGESVAKVLINHRPGWITTEGAQDHKILFKHDEYGEYLVFRMLSLHGWASNKVAQDVDLLSVSQRNGTKKFTVAGLLASNSVEWQNESAAINPHVLSLPVDNTSGRVVGQLLVENEQWRSRIEHSDRDILLMDAKFGSLKSKLVHQIVQNKDWAAKTALLGSDVLAIEDSKGQTVLDYACQHMAISPNYKKYYQDRLSHKYADGTSFLDYVAMKGIELYGHGIFVSADQLLQRSEQMPNLSIAETYIIFHPRDNAAKVFFVLANFGRVLPRMDNPDFKELHSQNSIYFTGTQDSFKNELDILANGVIRYAANLLDSDALVRFVSCAYESACSVVSILCKEEDIRHFCPAMNTLANTVADCLTKYAKQFDPSLLSDCPYTRKIAQMIEMKVEARESFTSVEFEETNVPAESRQLY